MTVRPQPAPALNMSQEATTRSRADAVLSTASVSVALPVALPVPPARLRRAARACARATLSSVYTDLPSAEPLISIWARNRP